MQNIRCAAHILQLALEEALKISNVQDTLRCVGCVVKVIRTPNVLLMLRRKYPKSKKSVLDVPTRWHSTFDTLNSVYEVKYFCQEFQLLHKNIYLADTDWMAIQEYLDALAPAKIATKKMQSEQLTLSEFYVL